MSSAEINQLLVRVAGGDRDAFRQLYDEVAPRLLAVLTRMLRDRHAAEDVLQETMVQTWHKAAQFDASRARATTWMTAIARHRALDLLRSSGRYREVVTTEQRNIETGLGTDEPMNGAETESDTTAMKLAGCFDEVGGDAAVCIRLAYLDGLTQSEIASRIARSVGTVKSWVSRGLRKLRECMQR